MSAIERLNAIEEIRSLKARYWRGVDLADGDLVRSILAKDCVLDYRGCCTDPASGRDFFPAMNVVLRGRDQWVADGFRQAGIVPVHQGHHAEITLLSTETATGVWSFTDRFHYPPGASWRKLTGHGYYHDTYALEDGAWKLATTRITRLRVEVE
ncbi:MAG: nuclear transport factor 2 family protein [Novosphingobium sp.]